MTRPTFLQSASAGAGGVINFRANLQNVEFNASYVCDPLGTYTAAALQLLQNVCVFGATFLVARPLSALANSSSVSGFEQPSVWVVSGS